MEVEDKKTERLFVYGIFLDEDRRQHYGMSNPRYTTIPGFITVGKGIVQAVRVQDKSIALTGVSVDMDADRWGPLDALEGGYDRIKVKDDKGEELFMYARHEQGVENFSTYASRWSKY